GPAPAAPNTAPDPADQSLARGPNHPDLIRPEHGAYTIHVKSYSGPTRRDPNGTDMPVRQLAEGLVADIRKTHPGVAVYLFEYISEEKKAHAAQVAAARQRSAAFLASVDEYRRAAQGKGLDFLEPDNKVYYKTVNAQDQVAVLVGGFRTEEEASAALGTVKKWPLPADHRLTDKAAIVRPAGDGKTTIEKGQLNPFPQAMVVPNPAAPRPASAAPATGLDPFVVKLNEGRPYSLLKATKSWTLGVKSFSAPVRFSSKDEVAGAMKQPVKGFGGDALAAGAEQAESLAKAIREMRDPSGKTPPLEAFVLHTRTASLVTVGQFDGPSDPALLETQRLLEVMKFGFSKDAGGREQLAAAGLPSVFGSGAPTPPTESDRDRQKVIPIPIPKR
ncbi:MAG: hypothetical protein K2X82_27550, partial [Gemmataceae bacterium]|nr:hypothetical protein [Gemmataceae bacterium]